MSVEKNIAVLDDYLRAEYIASVKNYCLKSNSYSKTGDFAQRVILPSDESQLVAVITFMRRWSIQFKVVGETTNILFHDSITYSVLISTKLLTKLYFNDAGNESYVEVGKLLPDFVRELCMRSYAGYEGLEGIPGTVGGAVLMNAGAYGYVISEHIISVRYIDHNNDIVELLKEQLNFTARHSLFREDSNLIIIGATFRVNKGIDEEIQKKMETYHIARHLYQEWTFPNLGSSFTFKKSIYDDMAIKKKSFRDKLKIKRKIYFNKYVRAFRRRNPSNGMLNDLAQSEFQLDIFNGFYSHKNLNTITNKNYKTEQIVEFLYELNKYLSDESTIENELVNGPVYSINDAKSYSKSKQMFDEIMGQDNSNK